MTKAMYNELVNDLNKVIDSLIAQEPTTNALRQLQDLRAKVWHFEDSEHDLFAYAQEFAELGK